MSNELIDLNLEEFPIVSVVIYKENAIVCREGIISLPNQKETNYRISSFKKTVNPKSFIMNILDKTYESIKLQNPYVYSVINQMNNKNERIKELKEIEESIIDLTNQKSVLENTNLRHNNKLLTAINLQSNYITKTFEAFGEGTGNILQLENDLSELDKLISDDTTKAIELNRQKNQLNNEQDKLQKQKEKLEQAVNANEFIELRFTVTSDHIEGNHTIKVQMKYSVPANWYPAYDLKISADNQATLDYLVIAQNNSQENFINVRLEFSDSISSDLTVNHPNVQNLDENTIMKLNEDYKQLVNIIPKGQQTSKLIPEGQKLTLISDKSKKSYSYLIRSFNTIINLKYYWNASETDYVVLGAEITNTQEDQDIFPGAVNFFLKNKIIGRGKIDSIIKIGDYITLPISIENQINVFKQLHEQINFKNGIQLRYKLNLSNNTDNQINIRVVDSYPLTNQPKSVITLKKCYPEPNKIINEQGLIIWELIIDSKGSWTANYEIEMKKK